MNKTLVVIANAASSYHEKIAQNDGMEIIPHSTSKFASGEPFAELFYTERDKYQQNVEKLRDCKSVIIHSPEMDSAEQREQLHLLADDLKEYGSKEVTAVLPCVPFDRQDKGEKGKFISKACRLFAKHLKASGVDRVVRLIPHSQGAVRAYREVFGDNFIQLSSTELFAEKIRKEHPDLSNVRIGAPDGKEKEDDEGQARAYELAKALFGDVDKSELKKHMFFIEKRHVGFDPETSASKTKIVSFEGDVKNKHCIIIDDMIDGGSTMTTASKKLKDMGASIVEGAATHGILSGDALNNLLSIIPDAERAPLDKLTLTDSLPSVEKKVETLRQSKKSHLVDKVTILSTAPLIAEAIANLPHLAPEKRQPIAGILQA